MVGSLSLTARPGPSRPRSRAPRGAFNDVAGAPFRVARREGGGVRLRGRRPRRRGRCASACRRPALADGWRKRRRPRRVGRGRRGRAVGERRLGSGGLFAVGPGLFGGVGRRGQAVEIDLAQQERRDVVAHAYGAAAATAAAAALLALAAALAAASAALFGLLPGLGFGRGGLARVVGGRGLLGRGLAARVFAERGRGLGRMRHVLAAPTAAAAPALG